MFADDVLMRVERAEPVWQAERDAPELHAALPAEVQTAARALDGGIPALRDLGPLRLPPYIRPPGHRRAFYVELGPAVLAIKGTEPFAFNFAGFIDEMARAHTQAELRLGSAARDLTLVRAELTGLDKFPVLEGKVPGCVTVAEALDDAHAAAAVQLAHLRRYGAPARLPMPILVARWPEAVADAVLAELSPWLRGRARGVTELAVRAGLGVYVYSYPIVPARLAHLAAPEVGPGIELGARLAALGKIADPRRMLDGWIGLMARLLALGFVSADPLSIVTGDCLQVQNAVVDGGFADVASLVEAGQLDDRALRAAVRHTVHELAVTATRLVAGVRVPTVDLRDRLPDLVVTVWNAVADAFRAAPEPDPRVAAALLPGPAFDRLATVLGESL
jgi:hypothetical protein